jgi:hypothetical protein
MGPLLIFKFTLHLFLSKKVTFVRNNKILQNSYIIYVEKSVVHHETA